jgi:hypothetical protein
MPRYSVHKITIRGVADTLTVRPFPEKTATKPASSTTKDHPINGPFQANDDDPREPRGLFNSDAESDEIDADDSWDDDASSPGELDLELDDEPEPEPGDFWIEADDDEEF